MNWRINVGAGAVAAVLAIALGFSSAELAVLALTIGLVLVAEVFNTAIEASVDAMEKPPSLAARHAKDSAAGAVLVAAITSVIVGALLFGPRVIAVTRQ